MKAATKLVVHYTFMGVELKLFKRPSAFRESPSTWESGDGKSLSPVTVNALDFFLFKRLLFSTLSENPLAISKSGFQ